MDIKEIVCDKELYTENSLPNQIGNSIYCFGSNEIKSILGYVDLSGDGSLGMIFGDGALYYCFKQPAVIVYQEISELCLKKNGSLLVRCGNQEHCFSESFLNQEKLGAFLATKGKIELVIERNVYEKIAYYGKILLEDIINDEYEDLELSPRQQKQIHEYLEHLVKCASLDEVNYQMEMSLFGENVLKLVEELELDSEEIDEIEAAVATLNQQEESMFKQAEKMFQENSGAFKNTLGIDLDSIKDKSPQELEMMLDDLCGRFNISKDQLYQLAAKFNK